MSDREQHLVELVDPDGRACGSCTVEAAHRLPGLAHRAFSVMLTDPYGRLLLQRRSATKTRFPLRWANACCGHPGPGQDVLAAAAARVTAELDLTPPTLAEVGVHRYHAHDPTTGRVEFEHDHVLSGQLDVDQPVDPDPDEVVDLRWLSPEELAADLVARPANYAPWLAGVLGVWAAGVHTDRRPAVRSWEST